MKFLRENSLTLFFLLLFLGALGAQAIAGHASFNAEQLQHGGVDISLWSYVISASYGAAVLENWQSEYLQFTLFILVTVWLVQRGSPESKEPGKEGGQTDEEQQLGRHSSHKSPRWARSPGLGRTIYSNSLVLVMGFIDLLVARPVRGGLDRVQRPARRASPGAALMGRLPGQPRLLGADVPELAVRVPGGRLDVDPRGLPAPARLARVQAGGHAARRDERRGLTNRNRPAGALSGMGCASSAQGPGMTMV
jgi:hypothetical protein